MEVYLKYLNNIPIRLNTPVNGLFPFVITETEKHELEYYLNMYGTDAACWEWNIIQQIRENRYGWFDFSKTLVDIGAGAGEYPIFAGFAHSYAFDPNRTKRCLIHANMLIHDMVDRIDVLPYAISDTPGKRSFNGWSEDVEGNNNKTEEVHDIEFRTLDSFNLQNVGLIKIDIEGFELFAIRSARDTIQRNDFPPLLLEVWPDDDVRRYMDTPEVYIERNHTLIQELQDMGYVMVTDPWLGDWETKFFIHQTHLNGYEQ